MRNRRQRVKFIVILALGLTAYLWVSLQVLYSGIEYEKLKKQKVVAINKHKDLEIEYSDVVSPANIEYYAKEYLGLIQPSEKQFRYIK